MREPRVRVKQHGEPGLALADFSAQVMNEVTTSATAAAAMTSVAIQPTARSGPLMPNFPMTFESPLRSIMTIMTGTATSPLITALQYSALIGLTGEKLSAAPNIVAMAMVA